MKVVFLQQDSFVKIAVEQLYAVLKEHGHESDLFIESGEKNFLQSVLESGADLFAFSCTTGGEYWVLQTAEKLKRNTTTPIMVGGPHPTFFPEMIKDSSIDYINRGEGEYALLDLLEALRNNPGKIRNIPNVWSKGPDGKIFETDVRPFISDLDDLPAPDFDIYAKYRYLVPYNSEMYSMMTGRGCPHNCNYCFNKTYKELYRGKGRYLRKRSPENVMRQLVHAKERYAIRKINFVDDCFFSFPGWLREFAGLYKEKINLPFIVNVEATHVKEEYVRLIREMGCICVRMGVETGNEHLRRNVLNKKITNQQIRTAAGYIKSYGIKLSTYNILGLPGETLESTLETYRLNKEIGTDFTQCSLLQPYPGTEIHQYISEKGYLADDTLDASFFSSSGIRMENKREIVNLQKLMQFFIQVHVPLFLVKIIIKLPSNPVF
ncbi:MAG: radical SAM protein, partial [Nitrospirota bacterium]|nr:radical SAM protein [Nitrospirota bacterium]